MNKIEMVELLSEFQPNWPQWDAPSDGVLNIWAPMFANDTPEDARKGLSVLAGKSLTPTAQLWRRAIAHHLGLTAPNRQAARPQVGAWQRFRQQRQFQNGSGYAPQYPDVHPSCQFFAYQYGPEEDWERGFNFEWPRFREEWQTNLAQVDFRQLLDCPDLVDFRIEMVDF